VLRLYLDAHDGASLIPCPQCGRPLLLGAQRMGRWLVGYRRGFRVRPGQQAMLVCPAYDCTYSEDVLIASVPHDAVIYSAVKAAWNFSLEERSHQRTLDEVHQMIHRLRKQYTQGGHPKLPSAVRFWREHLGFMRWNIKEYLQRSFKEGCQVHCEGKGWAEQGNVKVLMEHGVMLERSDTGETVFIRAGDLRGVAYKGGVWEHQPSRFDFGRKRPHRPATHPVFTPTHYVIIDGCPLILDGVTTHGLCRVRSDDPRVMEALQLWNPRDEFAYAYGEFPLALAERYYRVIRYCQVRGYRMHLRSFTKNRDFVQLETRDLEAARALLMDRSIQFDGERNALRWWGYFHRDEITGHEEVQVPLSLQRLRKHAAARGGANW
jgi:hypothetical protein